MTTTTPTTTDSGAGLPPTGATIDAHADTLAELARRIERLDKNVILILRIVSAAADKWPPLAGAVARAMKAER